MTHKRLKGLSAAAVLAMAMGNASAATITGSVGLIGTWIPMTTTQGGGSITTVGLADGIDFQAQTVGSATGDLATFLTPFMTTLEMTDFDFDPLDLVPGDSLWEAEGFSFTLTSVTIDSQTSGPPDFLNLSGSGMLTGNGFDATAMTWGFSSQGDGAGGVITWSSNNVAVVPLPPAAWLFGSALVGLVAVARRRESTSVRTPG